MLLEKGETIGGHFSLVRAIGEGGMGAVWAALDTKTNELVALKVLREEVKAPDVVRRFLREARAAMAVQHPNVVRIREVITVIDEPVIVMDYLEGESLRMRLLRVGKLELGPFAQMFVSVVSAIGTAHAAGVVHRDLKPDNIFLVLLPGGKEEPRVVDFGIAKLTAIEGDAKQSGHLTTTGAVLGTPYYMSPEQVFGDKHIDHRTDVWSLGTIAFECLSGRRPVEGDNIGQILKVITTGGIPKLEAICHGLPSDVYELVGRMLSFDRTKRPYDLREVLDIFQRHTSHQAQAFGEVTLAPGTPAPTPTPLVPRDSGAAASPFAATVGADPSLGIITPPRNTDGGGDGAGTPASPFASTTGAGAMSGPVASPSATPPAQVGRARLAIALGGVGIVAVVGILVGVRPWNSHSTTTTPPAEPSVLVASASVTAPTPPPPSAIASQTADIPSSSAPSASASKPTVVVVHQQHSANKPPTSAASTTTPPAAASSAAAPTKTGGAPIASSNPYQ